MKKTNNPIKEFGIILPDLGKSNLFAHNQEELIALMQEIAEENNWNCLVQKFADTPTAIQGIKQVAVWIFDLSQALPFLYYEYGKCIGSGQPSIAIKADDSSQQFPQDIQHKLYYPSHWRYRQVLQFKNNLLQLLKNSLEIMPLEAQNEIPTQNTIATTEETTETPQEEELTYQTLPSAANEQKTEAKLPKAYVLPNIDELEKEAPKKQPQNPNNNKQPQEQKYISNEKFKQTYVYLKKFMEKENLENPKDLRNKIAQIFAFFLDENLVPKVYENLEDMEYTVNYVLAG
ncbi:MAG: hypothetical protein R2798_05340 [Chitinophagales bacterium]|nr:hypothetical protein [Bacteroidota bacterium]MCB9042658.1 hypothetical protein [Chitinophagales bacterium]